MPQVKHCTPQPGHQQWLLTTVDDPQDRIALAAIDCTRALSEVYARVTFEVSETSATVRMA